MEDELRTIYPTHKQCDSLLGPVHKFSVGEFFPLRTLIASNRCYFPEQSLDKPKVTLDEIGAVFSVDHDDHSA